MKISVCMPVYNGALHIEEQLRSILSQLGPDDEVIVSDDRSTDHTLDVIHALGDDRVRVFRHPPADNPYRGAFRTVHAVYRNVEHALERALGEVIFLSDQDDVWLPGKVDRLLAEFEQGVELVLHDNTVVGTDGRVLLSSFFSWSHPTRGWIRFVLKCPYQGASMAFTRRVVERALPFPPIGLSHDHWLAAVEWAHGRRISFVHESLMLYRRHDHNVSPTTGKSPNSLWFKLMYRAYMLKGIWIAAWHR